MKRHAKRRIKKPSTRSRLPVVIRPINLLPSLLKGHVPKVEVNVSTLARWVKKNNAVRAGILGGVAVYALYRVYEHFNKADR